jgi:hypothetical protein
VLPEPDGEGDALCDGEGEGDVLPEPEGEGDGDGDALAEEEEGDGDADADAGGEADAVRDVLAGGDFFGAADLAGTRVAAGDLLRNSDSAGLMYAFAAGTPGRADDSGLGVTDTCDAEAGVVCAAPACDWVCGWGTAPVRAKTAAAEAATSPPVIHADASGRDRRRWACLATMPVSGAAAGSPANGITLWPAAGLRTSAAGGSAADP